MEEFESIGELYKRIEDDRKSLYSFDTRYPVRFIFLNSFDELKNVVNHLSSLDIEIVDLEHKLSEENTWFTTSELIDIIKNLSKNTIFLPLSEYLRFLDENSFQSTIRSITEIEKLNLRFYMPLVGIEERFEKEFWNNFYRKGEWAPIWKLDTLTKKIKIFQINFDLPHRDIHLKNFKQISTTNEWFNLWKSDNLTNIISFSETLTYFYDNCLPDQTFELNVINNQKEYLDMIFGTSIPVEFDKNEAPIWNDLIENVVKYNKQEITLKEIFLRHFNVGNVESLTTYDFVKYYFNNNNFYGHWLIKNLILSLEKFESTYLYKVFKKLEHLDNDYLAENLWIEIFNIPLEELNQEIFNERRFLLEYIHKNHHILPNEKKLEEKLNNIVDYNFKTQLNYLTGITVHEKGFILENIKNYDIQKYIYELKGIYPELYYYLDWDLVKPDDGADNWIIDYFREYNLSKIKNSKSNKIEDLIKDKNKDKSTFSKWFYSLPKPKIEKNSNYIWVDGLGAEWFPLIVHLISEYGREKGKIVKKKIIARVNLPSITKCNKYGFKKEEDLDHYIHKCNAYKYPTTLIEEIEIVKKIIKNIMDTPFEKMYILSDHGLSFLCLKQFGNYKRLDFADSKHEGRYMWVNEGKYSDDDYYITWNVDEGECKDKSAIVALKHVSLNNTPAREVHGGATPEEILVPYILIETEQDKIKYEIKPSEFIVLISKPSITFKILPSPLDIPEAFINDHSIKISFDNNNNDFTLDLKGLKAGKHLIELKIGNNVFKLKVDIKGGYIESDLI